MIGAGGQAGQGDAANLLKPALARGELRTIAATTWSEYKKYFEKDAALARRFQVVKVEEPTEPQCMVMMRGIVGSLEKHHKVRILDEAVAAGVRLSHRYLAGRQLPDKAVSVLDTACARLSLGQSTTPPAIEDAIRLIDDLEVQQRILQREAAVGVDHEERLAELASKKSAVEANWQALRERWDKERDLVSRIRDIRIKLEGGAPVEGQVRTCAATSPHLSVPSANSCFGGKCSCCRGDCHGPEVAVRSRRVAVPTLCAGERTFGPARRGGPDPRLRGCADRRGSHLRLDRYSSRQDDEG